MEISTLNLSPAPLQIINLCETIETVAIKEIQIKLESQECSSSFISDFPISLEDFVNNPIKEDSNEKINFIVPEISTEIKEAANFLDDDTDDAIFTTELEEKGKKKLSLIKKGKKKKVGKRDEEKPCIIRGYGPFNFFEREKFKGYIPTGISNREYIRQISAEWRKMNKNEKEPYLKMAVEFAKNVSQNGEELLLSKKRKRTNKKYNKKEEEGNRDKVHVTKLKMNKFVSIPKSLDTKKNKSHVSNINY